MTEARSTAPYPVRAFSGHEYVKYEWRRVPEGYDDAARRHPLLDVREQAAEQVVVSSIPDEVEAIVDATDAARDLAAEHGLDLASIEGSGADGRIIVSDVRAVIEEEE